MAETVLKLSWLDNVHGSMTRWRANLHKASPYYRQLSRKTKEIRLLCIDGTDGEGLVQCHFEYVSLQYERRTRAISFRRKAVFSYDAVSWCWGNLSERSRIKLAGNVVDIPMNAEILLRELCIRQSSTRIWLDAVCINQADLDERGQQVALMRDIYSKAQRVLIWLGSECSTTASGVESVRALYRHCCGETQGLYNLRIHLYSQTGSPRRTTERLPEHIDWPAIQGLYSSEWFTRLWVVQETVVARDAVAFCGHYKIAWSVLSVAAQWMRHRRYAREEYCGSTICGVENILKIHELTGRRPQLSTLLHLSTSFQSSEPLHKVYGVLGLLHQDTPDTYLEVRHGFTKIVPDYRRSLQDLYTHATVRAIAADRELRLLYWAQALVPPSHETSVHSTFPSWVPRYDWEHNGTLGSPAFLEWRADRAADAGRSFAFRSHWAGDVLRVAGVVVDELVDVSCKLDVGAFQSWDQLVETVSEMCSMASHHVPSYLRMTDHLLRTFAKTLAAHTDKDDTDTRFFEDSMSEPELAQDLETLSIATSHVRADTDSTFHTDFSAFIHRCGSMSSTSDRLPQVDLINAASVRNRRRAASTGSTYGESDRFHQAVSKYSINRALLVTKGHRLGMGPSNALGGDRLCILFGGRHPFILRQEGEYWKLIGDAFVETIMEVGQALVLIAQTKVR